MKNYKDLSERLLNYAANIINLTFKLKGTSSGLHITNQLVRSATSAGANYEEACGAESRADFLHKMQIVLKELKESLYWLKLIEKTNLVSNTDLQFTKSEAIELTKIIAKSIITAKSKR